MIIALQVTGFFAAIIYILGVITRVSVATATYHDETLPELKAQATHEIRTAPLWPLLAVKKLIDAALGQ